MLFERQVHVESDMARSDLHVAQDALQRIAEIMRAGARACDHHAHGVDAKLYRIGVLCAEIHAFLRRCRAAGPRDAHDFAGSVADQLLSGLGLDVAAAKTEGFRTIVNNRPDREEPGQPSSAELEAAAKAAGMAYHHIPVQPGQFSDAQVDAFCDAFGGCDRPALAFCKSGMRATSLWALSQAGTLTTDEILRQAASCGYDLTPLVPRIEARAKAHG